MAVLNSVASVGASHEVDLDETIAFLTAHAPDTARARLRRTLEASGNRTRSSVLPLADLARLHGASERSALYREHATALGERAIGALAARNALDAGRVTTVIFASSTGWAAPSIETQLMRRFALPARCRRLPLVGLGCAGGVAALARASEIVSRDPAERVLVVAAEVPSLNLQLVEPSYWELVAASQFADGAAAAIVSRDETGIEITATESVLLPDVDEGGRILPGETGFRLIAAPGLPALIRARVAELVKHVGVDPHDLDFVVAHPRGASVLDAVADGLSVERTKLASGYAAWERSGNMVSASVYRALAILAEDTPPRTGDTGLLIAFGTGVSCEMALARWHDAPVVARA